MRHRSLIALGMVFGLGLAVAAFAADKPLVAQGKIAHIDAKANTLTLAAGEEHVTFTLGANTAYTAFGKASTMARLRSGEQAIVHYTMSGETRMATTVEVVGTQPTAAHAKHNNAKPAPTTH